jgi:hypothetical protein
MQRYFLIPWPGLTGHPELCGRSHRVVLDGRLKGGHDVER